MDRRSLLGSIGVFLFGAISGVASLAIGQEKRRKMVDDYRPPEKTRDIYYGGFCFRVPLGHQITRVETTKYLDGSMRTTVRLECQVVSQAARSAKQ